MELLETLKAELAVMRQAPYTAVVLFFLGCAIAWWFASTIYDQHIKFLQDKSSFTAEKPARSVPLSVPLDLATHDMLLSKSLKGLTLRIADVAATDPYGVIRDRVFEDCEIYGPAVIAPQQNFTLIANNFTFPGGDLRSMLWVIPDNQMHAIGVIPVENVSFIGCKFHGIGIAGRRDVITRINENIKPK